ncbi:hypothetical protein ACFWY9_19670 [Amycolatopsis sp. NPDC059027]|uniref:hypothetical protein n=1 Tax=Amycolatopsis sp. NPDC059027 TaxID=3346709 RepID=UPI00366B445C
MATERTVLAIVHNITAATRLFDVVALYAGDHRIQTVFTCPGSSAFTAGTEEYLRGRGVPVLPWPDAIRMTFDWAIAASWGGDLHEVRAPLTVVPHGMGYNKFLETGNWKLETGNWKLETGNWKPETGNRKPETGNRFSGCRPRGCCTTVSRSPRTSSSPMTNSSKDCVSPARRPSNVLL